MTAPGRRGVAAHGAETVFGADVPVPPGHLRKPLGSRQVPRERSPRHAALSRSACAVVFARRSAAHASRSERR